MEELQPGAYFKVGGEGFEYVGSHASAKNPQAVTVVGRLNLEVPASQGALHRLFPLSQLEQEGVKEGHFCEVFPYSEYAKQKTIWKEMFPGSETEIHYPPQELVDTLKRAKEQGITNLEALSTPPMRLTKDGVVITIEGKEKEYPYPKAWLQLDPSWFWSEKTRKSVSNETLTIPRSWYIFDTTVKPMYNREGTQMYPNDPLITLLTQLKTEDRINLFSNTPTGSRFGITSNEIDRHVMPELAKMLGTTLTDTRIPTAEEINILGNMFHPELDKANVAEWFYNKFGDDARFTEGYSGYGALSYGHNDKHMVQSDRVGFRPIVEFPEKA